VVDAREFDIALDFSGDFYDDPTFQLTKYVSNDLSPVNFSGSTDRFLDALYVAQAMTTDPRQRATTVHDFERHALTESYTLPMMGVFNNLVLFKQDVPQNRIDSIVPDLATKWSWNADMTELTFQLRRGVSWHDGKPFTAADVKCTWDLILGNGTEKLRANPRK